MQVKEDECLHIQDKTHRPESSTEILHLANSLLKHVQKQTPSTYTPTAEMGVVQILVSQTYLISFYLHFVAFDFLYMAEF